MKSDNVKLTEKVFRTFLSVYGLESINALETPERMAKMWHEFLTRKPPALKAFPTSSQQMVMIKDFTTWGYCPHHLLPVKYTLKIGYIPHLRVLGLSKLPRMVDYLLSKLPLQEDLPDMIVDKLEEVLKPVGSGCHVKGYHLCCAMRGAKVDVEFITSAYRGVMAQESAVRKEFVNG